jgi:hypothetical protein
MTVEPRPVRVTWLDSVGDSSWRSLDAALSELDYRNECVSVGFLIGESELGIMLAQSFDDQDGDNVADTLFIPRPAVLEVKALT